MDFPGRKLTIGQVVSGEVINAVTKDHGYLDYHPGFSLNFTIMCRNDGFHVGMNDNYRQYKFQNHVDIVDSIVIGSAGIQLSG